MARLAGKRVIITGAAAGIGRAAARLFAAEGARLALLDVRLDEGEALVRELRDAGADARFFRTDVGDPAAMEAAVSAAAQG